MKQKAGIAIFLFGVLWSLVWGLVISISCTSAINTMTLEQLNESVWSPTGPLMMLWGVGGVPLGTVIAGIGHDKDEPLVSLVADKSVSTPTAITTLLNQPWKEAKFILEEREKSILLGYDYLIEQAGLKIKEVNDIF